MSAGDKIKWEDDDSGFEGQKSGQASDEFAALLGDASVRPASFMIGEKVKGHIAAIGRDRDDVVVDLGGKSSGIIELRELMGEDGSLTFKAGDPIEAFVIDKSGGMILLSWKMSQAVKSLEDLQAAFERKTPVKGRVFKQNKGGFEISILGKTAFCPISQIDIRPSANPAEHIGKEYEFLIDELDERGRNIVLSRARLLRAEAEKKAAEMLATLRPGSVVEGTVTDLRDYGAFVDLGGLDGMVHVSEISHTRLSKPGDALTIGEKVRATVLKIDNQPNGKPRIGLSIKAALRDPWDDISEHVKSGESYSGRVVNLMPFGAFVEVRPGIEGLVHVSEMSWTKRVHHPSEVLKVGDAVQVVVKDIDTNSRRISLTMKHVEEDPWHDFSNRYPLGKPLTLTVERLKPFGATLEIAPGISGMVPVSVLRKKFGDAFKANCTPGKQLEVLVAGVDPGRRRVQLTLAGIEAEDEDHQNYLEYIKSEQSAAAATPVAEDRRTGSFGALLSAKLKQKG